jgi:hypothetical protein
MGYVEPAQIEELGSVSSIFLRVASAGARSALQSMRYAQATPN